MKVLHLSSANELTGSGKAAILTHNELLHNGIDSRLLFLKSNLNAQYVYSYHKQSFCARLLRLIITLIDQLPLRFYPKRTDLIFSPGIIGLSLKNHPLIKWADIIHIHWANHGYIDIEELNSWNKPIIWTLRDMWAFTGGCHQSFLCENFKFSCGKCPELGSSKENDLSRRMWKRKMKYLRNANITWVAISSWMRKQAEDSPILKGKQIKLIYSGVSAAEFFPSDKNEARAKHNLPSDKTIILLGAENIRSPYKGYEYAKKVLNSISKEILIISFGKEAFQTGEIPQQNIHFGELNSSKMLSELYNAADVFLAPSIAEAMGKTFIEAQLCGLPVVCFDETGPADIVKHLETGYAARYKNIDDLRKGLIYCLNFKFDHKSISKRAYELFDISKIIAGYKDMYEKSIMDWTSCISDRINKI